MKKSALVCVSVLALVAAIVPAFAVDDCEIRMQKLELSKAEGQQRLDAKNEVIDFCLSQYKRDKAVQKLINACARYEGQPVLHQQFVAECQLAALNYANALLTLKTEFGKCAKATGVC
jgi:hypothetical protein